jgi:NADPH:quinone reductase
MPLAPGFEVAGMIAELGAEVRGLQVGDRLMSLTSSGYGAFSEQAVARAAEVVPIPDGLDYATATALYTAYGTAYHGLVQRGGLKAGETLVVLGAPGGVWLASVELGKALGARVIAVGRSEERLSIAREKGPIIWFPMMAISKPGYSKRSDRSDAIYTMLAHGSLMANAAAS